MVLVWRLQHRAPGVATAAPGTGRCGCGVPGPAVAPPASIAPARGRILKKRERLVLAFSVCGSGWNRTNDTRIFSPLLYRLSYRAIWKQGAKEAEGERRRQTCLSVC